MATAEGFLTGVVEGYYGRQWDLSTRFAYAGYLASLGLNTYLYCPKGDPWLRRNWQQSWPADQLHELRQLSQQYSTAGVYWGVGLSPFALYRHYGAAERQALQRKLTEIDQLQAPLLAILFDDMPGDVDALAQRQMEIVADVVAWMPHVRLLVCPTYYSFDPLLEKHFGTMPEGYWQALGQLLPPGVDVFWTGNKVCSESIQAADLAAINAALGRKVILWDNYPVNDGAVRSNYLYTEALPGRDRALKACLSGHLCNPMNQGTLSLPALAGLAALYGAAPADDWLIDTLGAQLWAELQRDAACFQQRGLQELGEAERQALVVKYARLPGAAAAEVAGWLRGEYTFDPACLTD
jgi:hypothetical protein